MNRQPNSVLDVLDQECYLCLDDAHANPKSKIANQKSKISPLLQHSPWDALLAGLALAHGLLLVLVPSVPLVALGMWWNANTISHNFIHLPFFRSRTANRLFSGYLSLLLGVPQSFWKAKHLAHHAGRPLRSMTPRGEWVAEGALVLLL